MQLLFSKLQLGMALIVGYARRHFFLFTGSLAIGLALVSYLGPQLNSLTLPSQNESVGMVGNFTTSNLPLSIQEKISFGLTRLALDDQPLPAAAKSIEATNSGKTLIFTLDSDLVWQDGSKFSALDIKYNLKGATLRHESGKVIFDLPEPFAPLPSLLSQPLFKTGRFRTIGFLPDFVNDLLFKTPLLGLGGNQVDQIGYNGRFLSFINLREVKTGRISEYKFFPTQELAQSALKLGRVNRLIELGNARAFQDNPYYLVTPKTVTDQQAILFFNADFGFFEDKTVRQALTYALPDTFSQGKTAESPLPEKNWGRSALVKDYPQNIDLAKKSLDQIATQSAGQKLTVKLATFPYLLPTALEIAGSWEKAGLTTTIELTDTVPLKYQVFLGVIPLPKDPDQYALWHSTQKGNIGNYQSFKVDRLLEDGRKTQELKTRQQIYSDFQKAITEDAPAAFLFYPTVYTIERKH